MTLITDTFRALVRRKLWPVALLLVAALVAVPLALAKQPEAKPLGLPAVKQEEGLPSTFVSATETTEDTGVRRRVLGAPKDPFTPAPLTPAEKRKRAKAAQAAKAAKAAVAKAAKAPKTVKAATPSSSKPSGSAGAVTTGGGSVTPSGGSLPVPPAGTTPAPAKTYPLYSIKVRFGRVDGELATKTIARLKVLPSVESPLLVYRGVEEGGKVAVFELTGSVVAQGDGACEPRPQDCQILKLRAGETEFLTVSDTGTETDAQYQLELEKIYTKTTTSAATAAKASKAGRELLRRWSGDRRARYAFQGETGTLHKLDAKSASKLTRAAVRASL